MARKIGILMISLEKLENRWGKLEKLELEILEMFPYRTLENKAGSSPVTYRAAITAKKNTLWQ